MEVSEFQDLILNQDRVEHSSGLIAYHAHNWIRVASVWVDAAEYFYSRFQRARAAERLSKLSPGLIDAVGMLVDLEAPVEDLDLFKALGLQMVGHSLAVDGHLETGAVNAFPPDPHERAKLSQTGDGNAGEACDRYIAYHAHVGSALDESGMREAVVCTLAQVDQFLRGTANEGLEDMLEEHVDRALDLIFFDGGAGEALRVYTGRDGGADG